MQEKWKDIPNWESVYQVSNCGRVKRIKAAGGTVVGRIYSTSYKNFYGYPVCTLRDSGKKEVWLVHRLVMLAFVGPCPDKHEVNHINGIRDDNRIKNLEYVTRSGNIQNTLDRGVAMGSAAEGASLPGSSNPAAKLTENSIKEIRKLHKTGNYTLKEIGKMFNVTAANISYIVNRKTWSHID